LSPNSCKLKTTIFQVEVRLW